MKLQLIPEWRLSWRFTSVQAAFALAFLSAVQADLLPMIRPLVPAQHWPLVSTAFGLAIILLRVLQQSKLDAARAAQQPPATEATK